MIDYKNGLSIFTENLNNNINFNFTKLGDGELECIRSYGSNIERTNCDGHLYTDELSNNLLNFVKNIPNIQNLFLAKWEANDDISHYGNSILDQLNIKPTIIDYNVILPQTYNLDNDYLFNFYKSIKENTRRKIYICPEKLNLVKGFLNIDIIINIPSTNCFTSYDDISMQLSNLVTDNDIIIYSASMMSKPLISQLSHLNITQIDFGSAMDSLFIGQTRLGQPTPEAAYEYFKNLIDFDYEKPITEEPLTLSEFINLIKTYNIENLANEICNTLGSSEPNYFDCKASGGLELQQIPLEYSLLLTFFKNLHNINNYLELGIGKGGSFLMNVMFLTANKYTAVDNISYWNDVQLQSINEKIDFLKNENKNVEFHNKTTDDFFITNTDKFDVIFIDADHSYEGVKKDYENSLKVINKGGYIIFHDINSANCEGVVKIWNDNKTEKDIEYIFSNKCGIGIKKF